MVISEIELRKSDGRNERLVRERGEREILVEAANEHGNRGEHM